uniref:NifU-like domain-containing protein n=1 Tax=uncultured marine group II/III euryarchaeote AD1000_99_D12 TaxID=1457831 RepID=A0A075G049_9EURY|nr:NifU-like domain-containing protein [uncultured marine group II/III euryarchaeote AD1000_99_D12]
MYVQTEETPNPNTLKFLPGKTVSEVGSIEFTAVKQTDNRLIKDILSMKEVNMVFLGSDFITVKKTDQILWEEIKPKIISLINEYYLKNKDSVLDKNNLKQKTSDEEPTDEVVKKIINVLDEKIRPAVARDGGDIKFKSFDNGLVTVELQGSCSGCPSSMATLKQGVQNLLCHYVSEVKRVEAV